MIASVAGQASRVAGRSSSDEFLHAAFEVSDLPAWRTKLLRGAAGGIASLQRQRVQLEEPVVSFCTELARAASPASIPWRRQRRLPEASCHAPESRRTRVPFARELLF
jgi:hypothetical protein